MLCKGMVNVFLGFIGEQQEGEENKLIFFQH